MIWDDIALIYDVAEMQPTITYGSLQTSVLFYLDITGTKTDISAIRARETKCSELISNGTNFFPFPEKMHVKSRPPNSTQFVQVPMC